jgi:hypothetical protein
MQDVAEIAQAKAETLAAENTQGIADMLGSFGLGLPEESKNEGNDSTDKGEEAAAEEPEEAAADGDEATDDEESVEGEVESESKEEAGDERIKALEAELAELKQLLTQKTDTASTEKEADKGKVVEFVDDEQYTEAISSKDGFNAALTTAFEAGVQATLKRLGPVIQQRVLESVNTHMAVKDFYDANPKLRGHEDVVQAVAQKLILEKGDKYPAAKLFKEAAQLTYKKLNLKPDTGPLDSQKKRNPGDTVPSKGGRAVPKPSAASKTNTQQDMMADLLKADI